TVLRRMAQPTWRVLLRPTAPGRRPLTTVPYSAMRTKIAPGVSSVAGSILQAVCGLTARQRVPTRIRAATVAGSRSAEAQSCSELARPVLLVRPRTCRDTPCATTRQRAPAWHGCEPLVSASTILGHRIAAPRLGL